MRAFVYGLGNTVEMHLRCIRCRRRQAAGQCERHAGEFARVKRTQSSALQKIDKAVVHVQVDKSDW